MLIGQPNNLVVFYTTNGRSISEVNSRALPSITDCTRMIIGSCSFTPYMSNTGNADSMHASEKDHEYMSMVSLNI